jgi:hypothetical protein
VSAPAPPPVPTDLDRLASVVARALAHWYDDRERVQPSNEKTSPRRGNAEGSEGAR